jgi:hypothetical protein
VLALHRLESRRRRKPLVKISFRFLSVLCTLLAALLLPLSARSEVLEEIHFQYRDGLIWLKVNIAGKSRPLNFLLDSGAGVSAIDLRIARTLGVLLGNRQIVLGVNGQGLAFQVSDLHAVCAGVDLQKRSWL